MLLCLCRAEANEPNVYWRFCCKVNASTRYYIPVEAIGEQLVYVAYVEDRIGIHANVAHIEEMQSQLHLADVVFRHVSRYRRSVGRALLLEQDCQKRLIKDGVILPVGGDVD